MPEYIGLLIFGAIVAFFVIFFVLIARRIEIGAEFAKERGWEFQNVLPQLGQAQRQHIFRGTSTDGIAWELVIHLKRATTQAIPTTSTIWSTDQIRSSSGIVLVGPPLETSFERVDLSNPVITMFFRMILGDDADQISDLKRVPCEEQEMLTILAANSEYANALVSAEVLACYHDWLKVYTKDNYFPVLFLGQNRLQFKARQALTKAAEVDAFVNFCVNIASLLRREAK